MTPGLNSLGPPPDGPAWAALALAAGATVIALLPAPRRAALTRPLREHPRIAVGVMAAAAALLSWGYIAHYLRGGPRIIDATSYFLEGRALSQGHLSMSTPLPSGSFRGRFLVTPPGSTELGVIFPPGYPAVLALGFLLGAPLAVGPMIAMGLVVATYALARELFQREAVALLAALLSVVCAALRYHTADTMSHGLSALLLASALAFALRGGRWLLAAGLAAGFLVATRPVSGAVAVLLVVAVVLRQQRWQRWPWLVLGGSAGLTLLVAHQLATTGQLLGSSQLRYYALADGPPGCFRYGFGAGIGCLFEHGDFVRARLPHGYGLVAALGTTGRRLLHHGLDIANAEPLALVVPFAAVRSLRIPRLRLPVAGVVLFVLAYAPFYFDATYPGGGARLYADVLPLEHALVAWGVLELSLARFALPVALAGFALRSSYAHVALANREGGRPMYEPAVVAGAGVDRGLVLVGTDHGFNLGFDPSARDLWVARRRDDAHDWVLWETLGRPATYRYDFDPFASRAVPRLTPMAISPGPAPVRGGSRMAPARGGPGLGHAGVRRLRLRRPSPGTPGRPRWRKCHRHRAAPAHRPALPTVGGLDGASGHRGTLGGFPGRVPRGEPKSPSEGGVLDHIRSASGPRAGKPPRHRHRAIDRHGPGLPGAGRARGAGPTLKKR